ncbi:unnamed protein product [Cylindrotheca closterium]|uniref:Uncharacterized protein n=1 Tax=Cylindrotheca closterium TaxID=2856 RepID=A0AAD2FR11_9STRA|nr:unnamed protein product [Cylindrotheca closterium]
MRFTTAELATQILYRYVQCGRLTELPMDHVTRCSTAAAFRIALVLNEQTHIPLSELVRMGQNNKGQNRFTKEEICLSEWHIFHCMDDSMLSPPTIEGCVKGYVEGFQEAAIVLPVDFRQVLEELICLAIHGILFLEYPVQWVGLGIVVLALRLCQGQHIWEAQVAVLYGEVGIEEGSPVADGISEICARLLILNAHFPISS